MIKLETDNSLSWDFYSLMLIFCFSFLLIFRWTMSPAFIDVYYHLSVTKGFNEAGGFVTKDFWEFAPVGRPHLYPPLLHFLMLLFFKVGFSLISIARLFEFIIYPLLLIVIWKLMEDYFDKRLAFFAVLTGVSIYSFYLATINFIPASLATVLGLLAFIYLDKGKLLASTIFMALCFYTHAITPWIFITSIIIYGFLNRARRENCLITTLLSFILTLPFLIYQFKAREFIRFSTGLEKFPIEINLWLYLVALPALIISFQKKGKYFIIPSLLIASLLPLFFGYRYRYLSGQSNLALIVLSAVSLEKVFVKSSIGLTSIFKHLDKRLAGLIVLWAVFIFFLIFSPTVYFKEGKVKFFMLNSTYINLVPRFKRIHRPNETSIYFPKYFDEIKRIVEENSQTEDIIYCNKEYVGGLISVFTNRVTSNAMLKEIKPYKIIDPAASAKLIIWIKDPDNLQDKDLTSVIERYNLIKITETDIAYIYKNPNSNAKKIVSKPLLAEGLIFGMLFLLAGLVVWDIYRKS
ncbi:MAG: hypothetical protein Q8O13_00555 [Candidatus Omnitrophota bacterium]|nr:hypothetical protein [Candidatus Omnitrophota bacterium]